MIDYFRKRSSVLQRFAALLFVLILAVPAIVHAQMTFGQIVIFGDSLSDPGNAFALGRGTNTPPYDGLDQFLIPDSPYTKGGHHFSNGATWSEQFARTVGLAGNARPAFQSANIRATNYAVGGARAHEDGINVNLTAQVNAFLAAYGYAAPADGLYVIEFGGNDVRDALAALSAGGDAGAVINEALSSIAYNITALHAAGARKFLVWNTPDLRATPAIGILDGISPGAGQAVEALGQAYNAGLDAVLLSLSNLPGIEIRRYDVYQMFNNILADPAAYGLEVVNAACVMPNVPPFECQVPDEYLFWDGIHPTKVVHAIIAHEVAAVLAQ